MMPTLEREPATKTQKTPPVMVFFSGSTLVESVTLSDEIVVGPYDESKGAVVITSVEVHIPGARVLKWDHPILPVDLNPGDALTVDNALSSLPEPYRTMARALL